MPLLTEMLEHSSGLAAQGHGEGMRLLLSQAAGNQQLLNIVGATTVQAQAGNADDAGLMMALQAASRSPDQGQTPKA